MVGLTLRTVPFPVRQRQVVLAIATAVTELAGWVEGAYLLKTTPIPDGFVLQLAQEFAPARITDRSSETMISKHPIHMQVLDIDSLVLVYPSPTLFVKKVRSLVGDLLMQPGHLQPCFLSILAARSFSGQLLL